MSYYWPSTRLSQAPNLQANLARELFDASAKGDISDAAMDAGGAASRDVKPWDIPITIAPGVGHPARPIFLRMPTKYEFMCVERAALYGLRVGDMVDRYFVVAPLN